MATNERPRPTATFGVLALALATLGCHAAAESDGHVDDVDGGDAVEPDWEEPAHVGAEPLPVRSAAGGLSPDAARARSIPIRFATYNVRTSDLDNRAWGDRRLGFDSGDAARMARVADTIAAQGLTVVAAQEVHAPERNAILDRLRRRHGQRWASTVQREGNDSVVLFRRDVWRKEVEGFFPTPVRNLRGPGTRTRYQVRVRLEHKASGQSVWFYSVHFSAGASYQHLRARAARLTVESIKRRTRPFVLGGDFNAPASSSVGDVFRRSGRMSYTRAAADRLVNDHCRSHNSRAGRSGRQSCPGAPARQIDHVWVSRNAGMHVRTHKVTATNRTSRASDHNPVTAILRLSE